MLALAIITAVLISPIWSSFKDWLCVNFFFHKIRLPNCGGFEILSFKKFPDICRFTTSKSLVGITCGFQVDFVRISEISCKLPGKSRSLNLSDLLKNSFWAMPNQNCWSLGDRLVELWYPKDFFDRTGQAVQNLYQRIFTVNEFLDTTV